MWENLADFKILVKIATSRKEKKQPVLAGCAKIFSSQEVWGREEKVKKKEFSRPIRVSVCVPMVSGTFTTKYRFWFLKSLIRDLWGWL